MRPGLARAAVHVVDLRAISMASYVIAVTTERGRGRRLSGRLAAPGVRRSAVKSNALE